MSFACGRTGVSGFGVRMVVVAILSLPAVSGCQAPSKARQNSTRWDRARLSATLQLASENIAAGKFERARAALAPFAGIPDADVALTLARMDVEEGQYAAALERLEVLTPAAVGESPPPMLKPAARSTYHRLRGIALEGLGRWREAAAAYRSAFELEPDVLTLAAWVDTLASDGQSATARATLERERWRYPGEHTLHVLAARLSMQAVDYDAAVRELATAALAEPDSLEILRWLAEAYDAAGRYEDAVEAWQRLAAGSRTSGERSVFRRRLARSLMSAKRYHEARSVYSDLVLTQPDDHAARLGLAAAYLALERPADALEAALQVLEVDGANTDARLVAAASYRSLGQRGRAVELLADVSPAEDRDGIARELIARWR